jgi:hypothetical protein
MTDAAAGCESTYQQCEITNDALRNRLRLRNGRRFLARLDPEQVDRLGELARAGRTRDVWVAVEAHVPRATALDLESVLLALVTENSS